MNKRNDNYFRDRCVFRSDIDTEDWFCLDNVAYHGRMPTILWDRTGSKFGRGRGLRVFADGRGIGSASTLRRLTCRL